MKKLKKRNKIMRLFKSRKSANYCNVSSVVANENDPNIKIVSCSTNQIQHSNSSSLHNNNNIERDGKTTAEKSVGQLKTYSITDDEKTNHFDSSAFVIHHIDQSFDNNSSSYLYSYQQNSSETVEAKYSDKFTPIPDCDKIIDESSLGHKYDQINDRLITDDDLIDVKNSNQQQQHQDSSDFINNLFGMEYALLFVSIFVRQLDLIPNTIFRLIIIDLSLSLSISFILWNMETIEFYQLTTT